MAAFLTELFESGRVVIASDSVPDFDSEADALLVSAERISALNFAGSAPRFSLRTAQSASRILYCACQFLVCRAIEAKDIKTALTERCAEPHSPEIDYSADLLFQFLPDIIGMTKAVASGDPLLEQLLVLAREWPLSSVGVAELGKVDVSAFIGHAGLRQVYVDRIIAREDLGRLGEWAVDAVVEEAIGAYPELCTPVARKIGTEVLNTER